MHLEKAVLEPALDHREARHSMPSDAAIAAGFTDRAYLQVSPLFRGLAGDPRMAEAIDRIGQHVARERAARARGRLAAGRAALGGQGIALSTMSRKMPCDCGWAKRWL